MLDETGLLPHTDVGLLTADELRALRAVAPTQGLLLRGLDGDLADQINSIEAAGALRIPFSVGLPVGTGESRDARVEVLRTSWPTPTTATATSRKSSCCRPPPPASGESSWRPWRSPG